MIYKDLPQKPSAITAAVLTDLASVIFWNNAHVGWWDDSEKMSKERFGALVPGEYVPDKYLIPTKIALMHSELSEALEGQRKNLPDDHLPQHAMEAVEYADAIIRILDVCGYQGYDIGRIVLEKLAYNAQRADHKREARQAPGGKAV